MSKSGNHAGALVSEALLINDIGSAVIEVENLGGIIILKGTVESEQDSLAAETLACEQEGVVQVINNLRVLEF